MRIVDEGIAHDELRRLPVDGVDTAGCPVEPFVDHEGGWPLRCCLTDSVPGVEVAIVSSASYPWRSPYRVVGPIVVHARAHACPGNDGRYPEQFEDRPQVVRPYGADAGRSRTLVYDLIVHVAAGAGLDVEIRRILSDPRVELVHAYNVLSGCYSFTARWAGARST